MTKPLTKAAAEMIDEDDPPPKKPPAFCPWCGGDVVRRYTPNRLSSLHTSPRTRRSYVCLVCKVGVRAFKFPSEPLFNTKKAAFQEAQRQYDELEASGFQSAHSRRQYERRKCTCSSYPGVKPEPCPIHRPLERRRR